MRRPILAAATAGLMLLAPAARAAPTCITAAGDPVRCGTAGALPVGAALTPAQAFDRRWSRAPDLTLEQALALVYILGALFAVIALLPPFDGWSDGDWDEQEGDRPPR